MTMFEFGARAAPLRPGLDTSASLDDDHEDGMPVTVAGTSELDDTDLAPSTMLQ